MNAQDEQQQQYQGVVDEAMNQTQVQGQEKSWKAIQREQTFYLDRQKNIAWFGKFGILVSHQSSNWIKPKL